VTDYSYSYIYTQLYITIDIDMSIGIDLRIDIFLKENTSQINTDISKSNKFGPEFLFS
jgi:hypothetical protein